MNKYEREIVLGYYLNGYGVGRIAEMTGYSTNSIRTVIKSAGLMLETEREAYIKNKGADISVELAAILRKSHKNMSPTIREALKKEAARLYRLGVDIKTISTIFNKNPAYIRKALKEILNKDELYTERIGKKYGASKRLKKEKFRRRTDLYVSADDRWTEKGDDSEGF